MQQVRILEFDRATLVRAVGGGSYEAGAQYARQRAVLRIAWDPEDNALRGMVRGHGSNIYQAAAFFSLADRRPAEFELGECSCPVAFDCKHAVALALAAEAAAPPRRPAAEPAGAAPPGSSRWSRCWARPGRPRTPGSTPLAIELTLSGGPRHSAAQGPAAGGAAGSLLAPAGPAGQERRLGRRRARLDQARPAPTRRAPRADQVRMLQELYALYRRRSGRGGYYSYPYGDDRSIDLTAFESRQLWPLLDEAQAAGLRLVYPAQAQAAARVPRRGDVPGRHPRRRRAAGSAPVIRVDGEAGAAAPVAFIGSRAHGVGVRRPRPAAQRRSRRLAVRPGPADPAGARRSCSSWPWRGRALEIPAAEQPRFRDEFYPRLRQAATVISSDGSFTPPEISGPDAGAARRLRRRP